MIYVLKIIWDYRGAVIGTYRPQYRPLSAIRYLDTNPLSTRYTLFSTLLLPQVIEGGIISLQYADDTLLFLENNLEKASTLKWLLVCFEQMSGMKINYDKSDLLSIGMDEDNAN